MQRSAVLLLLFVAIPLLGQQANDPEALDALGKKALAAHDGEKAAEYFEKAVELKPNSAVYHFHLGEAYGNQAQKASIFGQASLAGKTKEQFLKAVELDPNQLEARSGLVDYYTMAPSFMGGSEEKALQRSEE